MPSGRHYEVVTLYIAVMMSMLKDALLQQIYVTYKCSDLYTQADGVLTALPRSLTAFSMTVHTGMNSL